MFKILSHKILLEAPIAHVDGSRQPWMVRGIANLIELFVRPQLSSASAGPCVIGDAIVIFEDGARPYVSRKKGSFWRCICHVSIHGIMYGAELTPRKCKEILFGYAKLL